MVLGTMVPGDVVWHQTPSVSISLDDRDIYTDAMASKHVLILLHLNFPQMPCIVSLNEQFH